MTYLIFGAIALIAVFLIIHRSGNRKRREAIECLRAGWGKRKDDHFDFRLIARFADDDNPDSFHRLTDQTIGDIDLHRIFKVIDRTSSRVGQQYLFRKLIHPGSDPEDRSGILIDRFSTDSEFREGVQMEISRLNDPDAYHISSLINEPFTERPSWLWLLVLNVVSVLGLIILSVQFPVCLILLIIPVSINMLLHYWNKLRAFRYIRSFPQLNLLINVSAEVLKKDQVFRDPSVRTSIDDLRSFQKKTSLINYGAGGVEADLGQYVMELMKIFFLIEVYVFYAALKELETKRDAIRILFNYIGNIDASLSVASLRAGRLKTCRPTFIPASKRMSVDNMYHPLVDECVKNSLVIDNLGVLITGSNMSGKSTFLRTLVINSILAQTIHTCFADAFVSPVLKQFSIIRIGDDLALGKSHYLQEVTAMATLVAEAESSHQNLFVLDEVLKGTNTLERVAAAKAILSYLSRGNNIVIVSSHDLELTGLLKSEFELYHFTDVLRDNEIDFDHLIKQGPLKTTNGITMLELAGYPEQLVKEAREICSKMKS